MVEKPTEQFVFYLRNPSGRVIKETDPEKVSSFQEKTGYTVVSRKEGEAAFVDKGKAFEATAGSQ